MCEGGRVLERVGLLLEGEEDWNLDSRATHTDTCAHTHAHTQTDTNT